MGEDDTVRHRAGAIIDLGTVSVGPISMAAVRASFVLPLIRFVVIARSGRRAAEVRDG